MGTKKVEPERRRTVPIFDDQFDWWTQAVTRELGARRLKQKDLALKLGEATSAISRCINREKPIYELLIAISDELTIPYPVILPETEHEALRLAEHRRLLRSDLQLAEIRAGVGESSRESQTAPLPSEHAVRPRRRPGRRRVSAG
jgi:transcriptional regulator with XRE-family HTH domain